MHLVWASSAAYGNACRWTMSPSRCSFRELSAMARFFAPVIQTETMTAYIKNRGWEFSRKVKDVGSGDEVPGRT